MIFLSSKFDQFKELIANNIQISAYWLNAKPI